MRSHRVVLIFARAPAEEAHAKPLGQPRLAARLHDALLRRIVRTARACDADVHVVTRQRGATFGARLEHAVADAFAAGWSEVVVVGADAPALTTRHLDDAFAALAGDGARAVIGPAHDGGYYLLGLNRFDVAPFRGVPFHSAAAGAATTAALAGARFTTTTLSPLGDVDDRDDLRALGRSPGLLGRLARALLAAAAPPPSATMPAPHRRAPGAVAARGPPLPASIPIAV